MWSTGSPRDPAAWFDRLKEIGFTAEECSGCNAAPFVQNRFGFYVENLVPELGFLNNRKPIYDADFQGYTSTRDIRFLVRKPCFHDPAFWEEAKRNLQSRVRLYAGQGPLLYDLRDELSIGSFASPMDYCFGPHTLREFRKWVQEQHGTLEALNQEWETGFDSWDAVMPMTTYEVKTRERAALAAGRPENYAPWADHRAFMDLTFAQSIGRLREFIREVDPNTPVGIEGAQMPSAFGGYDLWRLSQVVDWAEPYDIAGSREVWRSFLPPSAPIVSTVFGSDFARIRRSLWRLLLHGDSGAIVWDDDDSRAIEKSKDGMPVTERGRGLASVFSELKVMAPKIRALERVDDRIAIHYSQASIRAHWMFDSREDRDTWPRRFSSYEATHSRLARVRDSFVRAIEDLGLQYQFVSYEQIENDELINGGYKVLLLPQSVAMSARECRRIDAFVRAGGTVIADNMTATMDERCRRLSRGQLDELFGIERASVGWSEKPRGPALEGTELAAYEPDIKVTTGVNRHLAKDVPVVIENSVDNGRAIYLNLGLHDYGKWRLTPPKGRDTLALFRGLLAGCGVSAPVRVTDAQTKEAAPGVEVWRYRGEDADYVALMRNPETAINSLGEVGYTNNNELEKPLRIEVLLPARFDLTDARTGEPVGAADHLEVGLDPWSPVLLRVAPAADAQARLNNRAPARRATRSRPLPGSPRFRLRW